KSGTVMARDTRRLGYGALAAEAAAVDLPKDPGPLKTPDQFSIIGKPTRTVDGEAIVTGRAQFGIDAYFTNTLFAVMLRCPHLDGGIETVDDSEARKVPGVKDVIVIEGPKPGDPFDGVLASGVAVLADSTWAALKGRAKLKVEWSEGPWTGESTSALAAKAQDLLDKNEGAVPVRSDGDFDKARKQAPLHVEARYEMPFLAHATMEPPGAQISIEKDKAVLIASLQ